MSAFLESPSSQEEEPYAESPQPQQQEPYAESPQPQKPEVVFSFQGAFGPPTLGHYKAMQAYANKVLLDYSDKNILMLFMPTALGSSKPHLKVTQKSRLALLALFCQKLNAEYIGRNITFSPSQIEYELCRDSTDTGTYRTINKLKELYPSSIILLGMGKDNMLQMPYWKNVETYKGNVAKIYVANRELTTEEKTTVRKFQVGTTSTTVEFDIKVPAWSIGTIEQAVKAFCSLDSTNYTDLMEIIRTTHDIKAIANKLTVKLQTIMENTQETYTLHLDLPEFVIVDDEIPQTSSSMMRYYIYKYIHEDDENKKAMYKDYITKLIWGKDPPPQNTYVDETIADYTEHSGTIYAPNDNNYENNYQMFWTTLLGQSGGKRKTTKKRGKRKTTKKRY
jgi:nicotinic acid mononucleotide adenylyltransferase